MPAEPVCRTSASNGLGPALLFFTSSGVRTTASMSARKLSRGTSPAIVFGGSPFSDNDPSRYSAWKNPSWPVAPLPQNHPRANEIRTAQLFEVAISADGAQTGLHELSDESGTTASRTIHVTTGTVRRCYGASGEALAPLALSNEPTECQGLARTPQPF